MLRRYCPTLTSSPASHFSRRIVSSFSFSNSKLTNNNTATNTAFSYQAVSFSSFRFSSSSEVSVAVVEEQQETGPASIQEQQQQEQQQEEQSESILTSVYNPFTNRISLLKPLKALGIGRDPTNSFRVAISNPEVAIKFLRKLLDNNKKKVTRKKWENSLLLYIHEKLQEQQESSSSISTDENNMNNNNKLNGEEQQQQENDQILLQILSSYIDRCYSNAVKGESKKFKFSSEPGVLNFEELSSEQQKVLQLASQGYCLFLGGGGGTGKTQTLKAIHAHLVNQYNLKIALAASTGCAAVHLGGQTFHSTCGIPATPGAQWDSQVLKSIDVLIVDEVSMIPAFLLESLNFAAKEARLSQKPFGGIQIILCGDFLQLISSDKNSLLFQSPSFQEHFVKVGLQQSFRHRGDEFKIALADLRLGKLHPAIQSRNVEEVPNPLETQATFLFPRRWSAESVNNFRLQHLPLLNSRQISSSCLKSNNNNNINKATTETTEKSENSNAEQQQEQQEQEEDDDDLNDEEDGDENEIVHHEGEVIYYPQRGVVTLSGDHSSAAVVHFRPSALSSSSTNSDLSPKNICSKVSKLLDLSEKSKVIFFISKNGFAPQIVFRIRHPTLGKPESTEKAWKEAIHQVILEAVGGSGGKNNNSEQQQQQNLFELAFEQGSCSDLVPTEVATTLGSMTTDSSPSSIYSSSSSQNSINMYQQLPVKLRIGARVMVNRNMSRNVVNGSIGIVTSFAKMDMNKFPFAENRGLMQLWKMRGGEQVCEKFGVLPVVKMLDSFEAAVVDDQNNNNDQNNVQNSENDNNNKSSEQEKKQKQVEFQIPPMFVSIGGGEETSFFQQSSFYLPLNLAYALTTHKAQGLTLSGKVILDFRELTYKSPHLVYVAVSRVRSLEQLSIVGLKSSHVVVDKDALEFVTTLPTVEEALLDLNENSSSSADWISSGSKKNNNQNNNLSQNDLNLNELVMNSSQTASSSQQEKNTSCSKEAALIA